MSRFSPHNLFPPFSRPERAAPVQLVRWLLPHCKVVGAVEIDANSDASEQTTHGGSQPRWVSVPSLTVVKMALSRDRRAEEAEEYRPQNVLRWLALFPRPVALDTRHRVVISDDPDRPGLVRYLQVVEPSERVARKGHWSVKLSERYGRPVS